MRNLLLVFCLCGHFFIKAQCPPLEVSGYLTICEKVANTFKGNYWKDWESVPMKMLLITDDFEYVLNAGSSDTTFQYGCDSIQFRPSSFNKSFLATFHLINWTPTIVVGTPVNTKKSPEAWVITLLHEHFHQLQFGHPEYFSAQKELDLAKGDQTGMWMLNHPYPYDSLAVIDKIREMSTNLLRIYDPSADLNDVFLAHIKLKKELGKTTGEEHHKYINLQLWQEGFTRYVEIQLLNDWINNFGEVDQDVFSKDQLLTLYEQYHTRIKNDLTSGDLRGMKRDYFYSLGAAEAMLINQINPEWKNEYFEKLYDTDHLLK